MVGQKQSLVTKSRLPRMPTSSSSKFGLLLAIYTLGNGSLCMWRVMTGTRRYLDDYVTMPPSSLRLSRRRDTRLFYRHVTFHCHSSKGISNIASISNLSCFTNVINQEYISNYLLAYSFGYGERETRRDIIQGEIVAEQSFLLTML